MHKEYPYSSCFAKELLEYIEERRQQGFQFDNPAYWLFRFDQFCVSTSVKEFGLTKQLFDSWAEACPKETKVTKVNRLTALRCFSIYLSSKGILSYIPYKIPTAEKTIPYLMDDTDIEAFFKQVDSYESMNRINRSQRMATEYKVLFRLLYCCGLRISEACNLKIGDVNIESGILIVSQSKGNKDRLIYLSEDLKNLCSQYMIWLQRQFSVYPPWFFPGFDAEKHIPKNSIDRKFNEFWNNTEQSRYCDKKPTVHCLRHAFVIKRMNLWMQSGMDLQVMMPYLSAFLGHKNPDETYYYYHQIQEAFQIIHQKDRIASSVIPEVDHD